MKNKENYKCRSTNLKEFLESKGFTSWDRGKDWNTGKPFWYFKFDEYGKLSKALSIWSENKEKYKYNKEYNNKFKKNIGFPLQ
jgi:hypothetical protein